MSQQPGKTKAAFRVTSFHMRSFLKRHMASFGESSRLLCSSSKAASSRLLVVATLGMLAKVSTSEAVTAIDCRIDCRLFVCNRGGFKVEAAAT